MSAGKQERQSSKQTIKNEQCESNPPKGMPQANSHSTRALARQGGYLWPIAHWKQRYATSAANVQLQTFGGSHTCLLALFGSEDATIDRPFFRIREGHRVVREAEHAEKRLDNELPDLRHAGRAGVQSLCVFLAGVRHESSTLFQSEIARDRGPEALRAIYW